MKEVDYLVIGAGLSGLAFVDELIARSDATIMLVDRRDAPGGHWNDVYPFVALHQPSSFYGVESTPLGNDTVEAAGPNCGFSTLAEGPEIIQYCHALLTDRLLASGRVTFQPMTDWDGSRLEGVLSGKPVDVRVRRKVVDASYYTNSIPVTHCRGFRSTAGVTCVPPNDLPREGGKFRHFTVLGGGKTAVDVCLWLLRNGASPDSIRWIVPRDQWFVNRAKVQPGIANFDVAFQGFVDGRADIAAARSAHDLALRHEASGLWLRLDPMVTPTVFHAAHVSPGELTMLRSIRDVVRLGRVKAISPMRLSMEKGDIANVPASLHVDCTASALKKSPAVPVFQPNKIVVQAIRFPQIPFSAALIAFLEATFDDDELKNAFSAPVPVVTTVSDYIRALKPDLDNRLQAASNPHVRSWVRQSRLDGFAKLAATITPDDKHKLKLLARVKEATNLAYRRLPSLIATLDQN